MLLAAKILFAGIFILGVLIAYGIHKGWYNEELHIVDLEEVLKDDNEEET